MFFAILGVTLRGLLFMITGSCFVAEFSGYWLHRLFHSDRFPSLNRSHLIHRFLICRPNRPLLKDWFVQARRLHDIHHRSLDDQGRMDRNFGIGFFSCERHNFDQEELFSLKSCSQALFHKHDSRMKA